MVARGILLPFVVTATGDVANGVGDALAISKVDLVLGTRPGEVDWRPDFGCGVHTLRHQNNTPMLAAMAGYHIRLAFVNWLPDLLLTSVTPTILGRALRIQVKWINRASVGAPLFPRELGTQIQVPLAAGTTVTA